MAERWEQCLWPCQASWAALSPPPASPWRASASLSAACFPDTAASVWCPCSRSDLARAFVRVTSSLLLYLLDVLWGCVGHALQYGDVEIMPDCPAGSCLRKLARFGFSPSSTFPCCLFCAVSSFLAIFQPWYLQLRFIFLSQVSFSTPFSFN